MQYVIFSYVTDNGTDWHKLTTNKNLINLIPKEFISHVFVENLSKQITHLNQCINIGNLNLIGLKLVFEANLHDLIKILRLSSQECINQIQDHQKLLNLKKRIFICQNTPQSLNNWPKN